MRKTPKPGVLTYSEQITPEDIENAFDDRTLSSLVGKVEHKDDWEALVGTLDRWHDRGIRS